MAQTRLPPGIRRLPSGRYRARVEFDGSETGHTCRTIKEANIWLAVKRAEHEKGQWLDPRAGKVLLSTYADRWFEHHTGLRPRTRETYASLLKNHIKPSLGPIELRRLTAPQVRAWNAALVKNKGQSTAAKAYRLLRTILATAVEDGVIPATPCVIKKAGIETPAERPTATLDQVEALRAAMPAERRAMVTLATWCGLRLSEILALTRERVDTEHQEVRVLESAHEVAKAGRVIGPPKSQAGRRTVAIPPHVIPELEEHLRTNVGPGPDAWLFTGQKGSPLRRATFYTDWDAARDKVPALPKGFRFHDLRHTGSTVAGPFASTKELMARHGQSSPRAALIYQHATSDRDHAIAQAMSDYVAEQKANRHTPGTPEGPLSA